MNSNMSCVKSVRNQSCSGLHFLAFPHIQTEYGEIRCIFVYRPNAGKMGTRITPNKDTFYAVVIFDFLKTVNVYRVSLNKRPGRLYKKTKTERK